MKRRHWIITSYLIIQVLLSFFVIYYSVFESDQLSLSRFGIDFSMHEIVVSVLAIIACFFLFKWKKWAFWLYSGVFVLDFVTVLFFAETSYLGGGKLIGAINRIVLMYAIFMIKKDGISGWKNLD